MTWCNPIKFFAVLCGLFLSPAQALAATGTQAPSAYQYQPQSEDERSLWLAMEEEERSIKNSKFLITDVELNAYIRSILCKTVGDIRCGSARIYLMRTAQFNASMAPNGMMVVWSGLLLRARNEAELATVLGHEFAHFENQHSLKSLINLRSKTNTMKMLSFVPYVGVVGQIGLVGSIFSFSRDMERQADLAALSYMKNSGYDPMAASEIWEQLRAEMDATAIERKLKSQKDNNGGFFATHPNSGERMMYLRDMARAMASQNTGSIKQKNSEQYRKALAKWWPKLIDDQIKLNDFGATEFLLNNGSNNGSNKGWDTEILFARGELYRSRGKKDDFAKAADFYQKAIDAGNAPPECWRGLGLSLMRLGEVTSGQKALQIYVKKQPEAADREMIQMMAESK